MLTVKDSILFSTTYIIMFSCIAVMVELPQELIEHIIDELNLLGN